MTNEHNPTTTHYQTLGVNPTATLAEIKAAYRRILLVSHPDKNSSFSTTPKVFDVSHVQDAYRVLCDVDARAAYDLSLSQLQLGSDPRLTLPATRPAQIVSLEEFNSAGPDGAIDLTWTYMCRCGGRYSISEKDMMADRHLIGCDSCSEAIYVGYDVLDEGEHVVE